MDLVVRHANPVHYPKKLPCDHCDDPFQTKFVRMELGAKEFNLHEDCYKIFVKGLSSFLKEFLEGESIVH